MQSTSMISFGKKKIQLTDHQVFMQELLDNHVKWSKAGKDDYAAAYLLLLHNFTMPKEDGEEAEEVK